MAKQYNCDYRTVKRYYEAGRKGNIDQLKKRKSSSSPLLSGFEEIIRDKLELSCSASSIYYFIKKLGYTGGYTTVKRYCRHYRDERVKKQRFGLKQLLVFQLKLTGRKTSRW